ncbi:hypothetical protein BV898_08895 [Hypsibius exemplaris]|uniref:Uncharacterized protein n=1 Tax=Hypsibius exemplaris TaxID=2072580 RepID=A0A1W0WPG7_HYPEX|nr:hypothetical protein BV898_08895 [Hypsibius exemplaris]
MVTCATHTNEFYDASTPAPAAFIRRRSTRGRRGLAVPQLIFGVVLAVTEVIGLCFQLGYFDSMSRTGAGIWSGVVFIATGLVGLRSIKPNPHPQGVSQKTPIKAFTGMSVVCAVFAAGLLCFAVISLIFTPMIFQEEVYRRSVGREEYYSDWPCNMDWFLAFFFIRLTTIILYSLQILLFLISASLGCCCNGDCSDCCCACCCSDPDIVYTTISSSPGTFDIYQPRQQEPPPPPFTITTTSVPLVERAASATNVLDLPAYLQQQPPAYPGFGMPLQPTAEESQPQYDFKHAI